MKFPLILFAVLYSQVSLAQIFTEALNAEFIEWSNTALVFADLDGDDDQDIIIIGYLPNQTNGKIYFNDGLGNYSLGPEPPFLGRYTSTIDVADIDGDDDLDVLITGAIPDSTNLMNLTTLYINDGNGNFTEVDTDFTDVRFGAVAFADIDGDEDKDVLITGSDNSGNQISNLYLNDGAGSFSKDLDASFIGIDLGSVAFADIDSDTDLDVMITGFQNFSFVSQMYLNDGLGGFSEMIQDEITPKWSANISFFDVDNDGDQDLITTGNNQGNLATNLYINDGNGNFSEDSNSDFVNVGNGAHTVSDMNGDGILDILITGQTTLVQPITISTNLYINDGNGYFMDVPDMPFFNSSGDVASADVDGDNDQDILIGGYDGMAGRTSLYLNDMILDTKNQIDPRNINTNLALFPNPLKSDNLLNVEIFSNTNTTINVTIFDLSGRNWNSFEQRLEYGDNEFTIDCSALSKGNYLIQFDYGYKQESELLLIE